MNFSEMISLKWDVLLPEGIIVLAILVLLIADLFVRNNKIKQNFGYIAVASVLLALLALIFQLYDRPVSLFGNTVYIDGIARAFKLILLSGAALVLILATNYRPKDKLEPYRVEYYYLFLSALLGAMFMASSFDLITLFVGLELLSLSSYILVGLKKRNEKANEAALKYIVTGGISTAITLFGFSYLYGVTGSTNIAAIMNKLLILGDEGIQYVVAIAFILILVGLSFKIATVPFQMWAPDVYEGSTTPVAAFLSIVSKSAGFILLIRLFYTVFDSASISSTEFTNLFEANQLLIGVLASITMVLGTIMGLKQRTLKRLMAYSSITHASYLLLGFSVFHSVFSYTALWFYLVAYLLMTLGAFTVIQVLMSDEENDRTVLLAGLYQRSPLLAVTMTIFLLSLAGIPITAGFIGKLNIFMLLLNSSSTHFIFAAILMLATIVSYVFYFGLTTQMFMRKSRDDRPIRIPVAVVIVLVICALATIALGLVPDLATNFFNEILQLGV